MNEKGKGRKNTFNKSKSLWILLSNITRACVYECDHFSLHILVMLKLINRCTAKGWNTKIFHTKTFDILALAINYWVFESVAFFISDSACSQSLSKKIKLVFVWNRHKLLDIYTPRKQIKTTNICNIQPKCFCQVITPKAIFPVIKVGLNITSLILLPMLYYWKYILPSKLMSVL